MNITYKVCFTKKSVSGSLTFHESKIMTLEGNSGRILRMGDVIELYGKRYSVLNRPNAHDAIPVLYLREIFELGGAAAVAYWRNEVIKLTKELEKAQRELVKATEQI